MIPKSQQLMKGERITVVGIGEPMPLPIFNEGDMTLKISFFKPDKKWKVRKSPQRNPVGIYSPKTATEFIKRMNGK